MALALTKKAVADEIGVSPKTISYFERFGRELRAQTYVNYCKLLKLDPYTKEPLEKEVVNPSGRMLREHTADIIELKRSVAALERHIMLENKDWSTDEK